MDEKTKELIGDNAPQRIHTTNEGTKKNDTTGQSSDKGSDKGSEWNNGSTLENYVSDAVPGGIAPLGCVRHNAGGNSDQRIYFNNIDQQIPCTGEKDKYSCICQQSTCTFERSDLHLHVKDAANDNTDTTASPSSVTISSWGNYHFVTKKVNAFIGVPFYQFLNPEEKETE